jgi:O-antigen ligase
MLFWMCGVTIVLAAVLGGGTHSGFYGDFVVQLIAVPLLVASLGPVFFASHPRKRQAHVAFAVCLACAVIILVQIVPLPLDIWFGGKSLFPNSDISTFAVPKSNWTTLSIAPQATWAAAASLIVPLSVFASVLQLGLRQRTALCWIILGLGAVSLLLGFLQMTQGPSSDLRFYEHTNPTEAVGFFANRNHFAALLNVTLILSALWFYPTIEAFLEDRALRTQSILWFLAAATFLVATVAGIAMARSRAGVILAMVALTGVVMMVAVQHRSPYTAIDCRPQKGTRRVSFAVVLFAALFALQVGLGGLAARFESSILDDLRIPLARTTFETALKALPFGTGLGSFVPVYATVEKRQDVLAAFANRAHNDFVELFLETGLLGIGVITFFLTWLVWRSHAVWSQLEANENPTQSLLLRASTLIVVLLLAHSLVDYPLRTTALSTIFAVFCGFLAEPVPAPDLDAPKPRRRTDFRKPPKAMPQVAERRTADIQWPTCWQKKDENT